MSPEPLLLDDIPDEDNPFLGTDVPSGSVACPECGEYFKPRGLTRHRERAHGVENPNKRVAGATAAKGTQQLALQWAEFQRGAALFVSFACGQCAAVLVEDAQHDGDAIANFCEGRPKLKKQIQQALTGMDIMILVGALGETARKMISHHDLGRRIGLGDGHTHATGGSAQEKMMSFLTTMDPDARTQLLNQVFSGMAASTGVSTDTSTSTPVTRTVTLDDENTPGQPPTPVPNDLSPADRYQVAMAHSTTGDFVESV